LRNCARGRADFVSSFAFSRHRVLIKKFTHSLPKTTLYVYQRLCPSLRRSESIHSICHNGVSPGKTCKLRSLFSLFLFNIYIYKDWNNCSGAIKAIWINIHCAQEKDSYPGFNRIVLNWREIESHAAAHDPQHAISFITKITKIHSDEKKILKKKR
jgi:hypothetical protein